MNNKEAVNWLINISADIGKAEHSDLWHYEQALSEIRELLESAQPERNKGEWLFNVRGCHGYTCPYCGIHKAFKHNFCPNCGADMREGDLI